MNMRSRRTETHSGPGIEEYIHQHQELLDVIPHPVFIVNTAFCIVYTNHAMNASYSLVEPLTGRKCLQVFHQSECRPPSCPAISNSGEMRDGPSEIYIPSLEKNIMTSSTLLYNNSVLIGALHSVTDISAIRKSEEDLRDLLDIYAHSVNDMKVREQKALIGREAFLNMLEDLNDSYKELEDLFMKFIRVMVSTLDAKSPWTKGHSERVSMYAELIAKEMQMDEDEIKDIRLAGLLHDIGKIGTYDYLLDKPGKLTPEEFDLVKKHPVQGTAILRDIKQLKNILPLIEYHHEKIDGSGYPHKLKGSEIPPGARILHVADSFDSMTSDRPYRKAPGFEYAISELHKYSNVQFDPKVVKAFLVVLERQGVIHGQSTTASG